ncbi:hypothetical protein Trydic_g848 [Trypoxylus dichotomus]
MLQWTVKHSPENSYLGILQYSGFWIVTLVYRKPNCAKEWWKFVENVGDILPNVIYTILQRIGYYKKKMGLSIGTAVHGYEARKWDQ